jgi:hypothetical protein
MIGTLTPGKQRRAQRGLHLLAAGVLLAYLYAPLDAQLEDIVRFAVVPALTLTGVAMWQSARIRRALRARRGAAKRIQDERPQGQIGRWPHATPRNG